MIASKGSRSVKAFFDGENKHVTLVMCVNAAGEAVVPTLIFTGERPMAKLIQGWGDCCLAMSDSGFITDDIWVSWVKKFIEVTGGNCVLISDHHVSRSDPRALHLLREANVKLMCLQPHTTHVCQPLDVGVFASFKHWLKRAISAARAKGVVLTHANISPLIKEAYDRCLVVTTDPVTQVRNSPTISGFRKTGIFPFDPSQIGPSVTAYADNLQQRLRAQEAAAAGAAGEAAPETVEAPAAPPQPAASLADVLARLLPDPQPSLQLRARLTSFSSRSRVAELMPSDEVTAAELAKVAAKRAAEEAVAGRKRIREANQALEAAGGPVGGRGTKRARAAPAAAPAAEPAASSSSSASSAAAAPAARRTYVRKPLAESVVPAAGSLSSFVSGSAASWGEEASV